MLTVADSLQLFLDVFAIAAAVGALAGALYIARNKGIIANYEKTVEAQEARLTAQDGLLQDQSHQVKGLETRLAKMEGERDGYRFAVQAFVEAVTTAGICAKAWKCEDRVVPTVAENMPSQGTVKIVRG
jgi:hypothetical protein